MGNGSAGLLGAHISVDDDLNRIWDVSEPEEDDAVARSESSIEDGERLRAATCAYTSSSDALCRGLSVHRHWCRRSRRKRRGVTKLNRGANSPALTLVAALAKSRCSVKAPRVAVEAAVAMLGENLPSNLMKARAHEYSSWRRRREKLEMKRGSGTSLLGDLELASVLVGSSEFDSLYDCESSGELTPTAMAVAKSAIAEARKLMESYRLLDAEAVLLKALAKLGALGVHAATRVVLHAPVFQQVASGLAKCRAVGNLLEEMRQMSSASSEQLQPALSQSGLRLWVQVPERGSETWFTFRALFKIDAPLHACIVATHETDLQPRWLPFSVSALEAVGPQGPLCKVVHAVYSILSFKAEMLYEVTRVLNRNFGVLIEHASSVPFPAEYASDDPQCRGVHLDISSAWIPCGGGAQGTILVLEAVVDPGILLPELFISHLVHEAAPSLASCFRAVAESVKVKDDRGGCSPWQRRLSADETRLYRDLQALEVVASMRPEISESDLPGQEAVGGKSPGGTAGGILAYQAARAQFKKSSQRRREHRRSHPNSSMSPDEKPQDGSQPPATTSSAGSQSLRTSRKVSFEVNAASASAPESEAVRIKGREQRKLPSDAVQSKSRA
eukprot:gnl/TRDRNA2_/TRDRNA2_93116_c0_seq1.p1 gnl/TRDRNA2_/TRDRNA2_93116_c0~~gnl/TRDRNA2_/TRDRNA2_93116_c0_seq1.p1  ORF type:complete len:616 (+),score=80.49 gnl/TRDRNA2_/TRDRNA2_93116_c0_seq1:98-1945(+)